MRGLATILQEQLPTGEIPSYRLKGGVLEYRRSPFISTFVYDALGCFDSRSPWCLPQVVNLIPTRWQFWFTESAAEIRQHIRAFLVWQEESDGTWRFLGRGSGIDADADSTSCAAAVLWESASPHRQNRSHRYVRALERFRSTQGSYFSYVSRSGRGYSWMDESGRPLVGFDRVVNANVLRYLALAGIETKELITYLEGEITSEEFLQGSHDYPNPLCFCYCVARAWRQADLRGWDRLARLLCPRIVEMQTESGDFGGALSTALGTCTLLDLAMAEDSQRAYLPAILRARTAIMEKFQPWGGWGYEAFFTGGYGSPSLTTAAAMMALARSSEWVDQ
jgi:hypothetical protein